MELIPDALPITEYVTSRHLSVAERLGLFRQVCDAIAYVHERGIVHRDLKPSNLLVDGLGRPKVIDCGVACGPGVGERVTVLTEAGQLIGTLQYMSPEQVSGQSGDVDARADVYSLGVVLYEILTGQMPHPLRGLPLAQAARVIHEQRPRPLRSICPEVPREVAAIVEKCLNKQREARFQTAGELLASLRDSGASGSWRRSVVSELRTLNTRFSRCVIAGVVSASVILGCLSMMPPRPWRAMARLGAVESGPRTGVRQSPRTAMPRSASAEGFGKPLAPAADAKEVRLTLRHQQEEQSLCSVTCASMILDYFGVQTPPRALKVMSRGRDYGPDEPFDDFSSTLFQDVCRAVGTLGFAWSEQHFTNDRKGFVAGLQRIRQAIDAGNPVLIDLTNAFGQFGSHVFVVSGYSDRQGKAFVVDAHAAADGTREITYEDLMSVWNSLGMKGSINARGIVLTSPKNAGDAARRSHADRGID